MQIIEGKNTFYADSQATWREWLMENHQTTQAVWLIIYKKESGVPSVYYSEAVDEALCFGWIDSKPNKRDENSFYQFFSQRNPKSNWSKVNKLKVEALVAANKMMPAGFKMIELAKQIGTWDALNDVDALIIPEDLAALLAANPPAQENFDKFPPSTKRGILEWILNAKQAATRLKRIEETVALAAENKRANQYEKKK
jgi:uncharacterized protein YdeI (YjbR/CyaY-like superfamily)